MEKHCGKTCGECGKVRVFNRYFGGFHCSRRMCRLHIRLHKGCFLTVASVLCRQGSYGNYFGKIKQKVDKITKLHIGTGRLPNVGPQSFVEMSQFWQVFISIENRLRHRTQGQSTSRSYPEPSSRVILWPKSTLFNIIAFLALLYAKTQCCQQL